MRKMSTKVKIFGSQGLMSKIKFFLFIPAILILTALGDSPGILAAGPTDKLIIAKPFGPSVKLPDPAKGYNGWYTSEAGVTETLFVLDFDMNLKPWLAQSYKNLNPLAWEIKLKKGLRFHDNTSVSASAVKWSFDRIIDEKSEVFNKRIQGLLDLKTIIVRDSHTLLFETHKPNAAFLYDLTSPGTGIIGPNSNKKKIYGTGPFMLVKVIPKEKMIISGFGNYWGGKPNLAKVFLEIVNSPTTRMLAFEAGQVDMAINFPETDVKRIKPRKNVRIIHQPTTRLCFFFVRVFDGPLADIRVRQALNYALDREEIVDAVLAGIGGEAGASIFPAILPWNNRDLNPYPYDPARAEELLTDAGAFDTDGDGILEIEGRPLTLNAWTYEGRASLRPTLELIQTQLNRVGIALKLKITKKGSPINRAMKKGEVHLNLQMWNVAPQGDPDYFISNVFTGNAGSNFMGYYNEELDGLAKKGKITFDFAERKKIYDRIQEIIFAEIPVIVLFHKSMVSAVYDYVKNYRIHPAEKYLLTRQLSIGKAGAGSRKSEHLISQ